MEQNNKTLSAKDLFGRVVLLIFLAVFISVTIYIAYNMSFGWFVNAKKLNGDGMAAAINTPEATAEYFAYVYDVKEETVHYTGEGRTDENGVNIDPTIYDLDMQFHDTIFERRNRYTPAIVRIRLSNVDEAYLNGGTVHLTIARDTSIAAYDHSAANGYALNEYFTSIMRFSLANNGSWYNANAVTLYNNLDSALYTKIVTNKDYTPAASSAVFTTVEKSGSTISSITKANSITISADYTAADISNGYIDIYLYITYDTGLVNEFEHSNGIDTTSTAVGKITTMKNDLATMTVSLS